MKNALTLMKKIAGFSAMAFVVLAFSTDSNGQISCTDNNEPNDSKQSAAQIATNQVYHALIRTTLDVDWFMFDVAANQANIRVTLFDLPKNYNLFLFNSGGDKIGTSKRNSTNQEIIVMNDLVPGTYYVKIRGKAGVFDPINCYSLGIEATSTLFKEPTAVDDFVGNDSKFELYPNPASSTLFVQCDDEKISSVTLSVFNLLGQKISETKVTMNGNASAAIDVNSLNAGEYLLAISYEGGKEVRKIVVSK